MQAAIIDTRNGAVLVPPHIPGSEESRSAFHLPTCGTDLRELQFHTNSLLLGIPSAGDGAVYFFVLSHHTWRRAGSRPQLPAGQ